MEEKHTIGDLSPEEWTTAQHLVEVVRQNDLGTNILIYFEHDFSAFNAVNPLSELVITSPIESASVKGLARKKMIDFEYFHGDNLYIIKLRENIFAAVDAGLKMEVGA